MRCTWSIVALAVLVAKGPVVTAQSEDGDAPPEEAPVEPVQAEVPVEAAAESVPIDTPPEAAEAPLPVDPAAESTQTGTQPKRLSEADLHQPGHLCKVETEEALKLLGTTNWTYGSWVYSLIGTFDVENGVAECKLLCDEEEHCHRWVWDCDTKSCRHFYYGGMSIDEDNKYSFIGEAKDISAKLVTAIAYEKEQAAISAAAEEAARQKAQSDLLKEANAANKAKVDVEAAQIKIEAMKQNRRLAAEAAKAATSGAVTSEAAASKAAEDASGAPVDRDL